MSTSFHDAVKKPNELRNQYVDRAFRHELELALSGYKSNPHPIYGQLEQSSDQLALIRMLTLQSYQLTKNISRYIGALYNHCPIRFYRKRLAVHLYEEETGMLSKTANHKALMQRFIRALGIGDDLRERAVAMLSTRKLIDYCWGLVDRPETFHMGAAAVLIGFAGQYIVEQNLEARNELMTNLFGLTQDDLAYFSVHASEDISHIREGLDCVAEVCITRQMKDEALYAIHHTCELFGKMYEEILEAVRRDSLQLSS